MAYASALSCMLLLFICSLVLLPPLCHARIRFCAAHPDKCNFTSIYQIGDVMSDTGNFILESPTGASSAFARLPYAAGRCSNGLLTIDYIAKAIGLPLLNPYLNKDADFTHGVIFAVAGATALPTNPLADKHMGAPVTNSSLGVQLDWMWSYFNSICYDEKDCAEKLENALFIVGEIGGSDYNLGLLQGKTVQEVKLLVPDVVQAISDGIKRVISMGATRVIVPGSLPIGCFPAYLSAFKTNDAAAYDENNCLKELNELSVYHNDHLKQAIQGLIRPEQRNVSIVYADYYSAFLWLLHSVSHFGMNGGSVQKCCCGTGGGAYNFDEGRLCGSAAAGAGVCANPDGYIHWDGLCLTRQANRLIAHWLLHYNLLP